MRCVIAMACMVLLPLAAAAQGLDLTGATQVFQISSTSRPHLRGGEPIWWPAALNPRPLTAPAVYFSLGMDPSGAYPASGAPGNRVDWSSWPGEAEAYPNTAALYQLHAAQINAPYVVNASAINLIARPMPPAVAAALPSQIAGRTILSGALNCYPYSQQYGYFEMNAQIPKGNGLWPAFWLRPVDYKSGEIDIMEILGKDTTVTYSSIHTSDPAWNAAHKMTFWYKTQDLSLASHAYGVDWEADTITFYLDRVAIETVPTPSDMHKPYFILADLAVGGATSWPGPADSTTVLPAVFKIQSIGVWTMPRKASAIH